MMHDRNRKRRWSRAEKGYDCGCVAVVVLRLNDDWLVGLGMRVDTSQNQRFGMNTNG